MKKLLFIGFGYTAENFFQYFSTSYSFFATFRDEGRKEYFKKQGIIPVSFKKINEVIKREEITHILYSIPPISDDITIEMADTLTWFGYLSATSVYGDYEGQWIDENSKLLARSQRGINRIKEENKWLQSNLPVTIFRLSGIYGPGRSLLERINKDLVEVIPESSSYFSRIHIYDICHILRESMEMHGEGNIFNLSDDYPSLYSEAMTFAFKLMNKKCPQTINAENANLSKGMLSFFQDSKKVSNKKVKDFFDYSLKYPSFHSGFRSCLK